MVSISWIILSSKPSPYCSSSRSSSSTSAAAETASLFFCSPSAVAAAAASFLLGFSSSSLDGKTAASFSFRGPSVMANQPRTWAKSFNVRTFLASCGMTVPARSQRQSRRVSS
jgi:hypothetical protein